jgi:ribosomal protein S18 acetylase RimI-like enzyme
VKANALARLKDVESVSGGWSLGETRDRDLLLRILDEDRAFAAYAIGDLEPSLFDQCQWVVAEHDDGSHALALLFKGFDPPALVLFGDAQGTALILSAAMRPTEAYAVFAESHLPSLEAHYGLAETKRMLRMVWSATTPLPQISPLAFRLSGARLAEMQSLYRLYAEAHFSPYQLMQGIFYGVERDGRLVSVAGTHLVSPTYGVAAIGNVFTHPDYRGRGYAQVCTAEVLRELCGRAQTVVLNVEADNGAALHLYDKLGFSPHCDFYEAMAWRKNA